MSNDESGRLTAERRSSLTSSTKRRGVALGGSAAEIAAALVPAPADRYAPFPLTDVQQAYWIGRGSSFEFGGVAGYFYYEIESPDLDRVTRALRRLIDRHDVLRLVVLPDGQQQVLEHVPPYEIERVDLRAHAPAEAEAILAELREQLSHQVLDPERWPLFDVRAVLLPDRVRLLVGIDGLLLDGTSLRAILDELAKLYADVDCALPEIPVSFRDYVLAEHRLRDTPGWKQASAYWDAAVPDLPPAPDLPLARGRPSDAPPKFTRYAGALDAADWAALKARIARAGLTPSGVLLAAYAETVAWWATSPRFTLNVALLNRLPVHPQIDQSVGPFSTFLLLGVDMQRADSFEERARRTQKRLWQDLPWARVGGVEVLRRLSRQAGQPVAMPIGYTSVLRSDKPGDEGPSIGDLSNRLGDLGQVVYKISQTPQLSLDLHIFEVDRGLGIHLDAVEERFAPGVCEAMFDTYRRLVERLARDPEAWKERAPAGPPGWQLDLHAGLNETDAPAPEGALTTAILAQAERHPDALAVVAEERLSYAELVARARRLARTLLAAGAAPGARIGVVMEKGWEQAAAAIGVLEAQMAYLPVDPAAPPERLALVLENAGVELVVTQSLLAETLEWPPGVRVLAAEEAWADATPWSPERAPDPDALAMVILTSGSTGAPRGVMLPHRGPLNAVMDLNRRFGVTSRDRVLSLTPMQHDMAAYDLFGVLGAGGTVVMPRAEHVKNPAHWLALLRAERITVWNSVPAMMQMLLDYVEPKGERLPDTLRLVMLGGDFIPLDFPRRLAAQVPGARLVSIGGPTETSIVSICYPVDEVDPTWTSIPYGRPLANQRVYVLDEDLDPRPVWVPGEIWSGGLGLARGFIGNEAETKASFVAHPRTGERLYRTGDRGLLRPDGNVEILGRVDFQVKINGVRIEPAEIDQALRAHPHVREALTLATGEAGGRRALVAYVVVDESAPPSDAELRDFLVARLPRAMVPTLFVRLEAFPLNANGKVDRRALPAPPERSAPEAPAEPSTLSDREQAIQAAIASSLDIDTALVTPTSSFIDLGGDSLRAVIVQSILRKKFGVEVDLGELFKSPTIKVVDAVIAQASSTAAKPLIERRADCHEWRVSSAQARIFFLQQIMPDAPIFNLAFGIRLKGALDVAALEAALREIKRRHETLRATFSVEDGKPVQRIREDVAPGLERRDYEGLAPEQAWEQFAALATAEARRRFDLASDPLHRELLVCFTPHDHVLMCTVHHIAADAWSFGVILRDLHALYGAFARGEASPLPAPALQYADYAEWELRSRDAAVELLRRRYWRKRLAGAPPFASLPTDREPPKIQRDEGAFAPITLADGALRDELRLLCAAEGVTPFMALLAVYGVVLSAWGGQRDVVIGAPVANRNAVETELLVGCFVNMIPLRVDLTKPRSFRDALRALKDDILADFGHELPFEQLVRAVNPLRSPSRQPIFQVVLQIDAMTVPSLDWPGLRGELFPLDSGTARYELAIRILENQDGLAGQMNYRRDLWDAATMERLATAFAGIVARAVREPDVAVATLEADASVALGAKPV